MSDLSVDRRDDPRSPARPERGARSSARRATCGSRSPSVSEAASVSRRRRHDDLDFILAQRGRKKKRGARIRRRRRAGVIVATLADRAWSSRCSTLGLGAGAALSQGCDLNSLQAGRDRPELVRLRARRLAARLDPRRAEPRAGLDSRQMSKWLPLASVAIEDRRFYQHGGVDYEGIARAAWKDVTAGKVVEGGSTITQQLVRNLYTGQEKTFNRKLKEACLAIKLVAQAAEAGDPERLPEHRLLRQPRLRRRGRVRRPTSRSTRSSLTLAQSALLAGLPQAPSVYDPFHNPKARARAARRSARAHCCGTATSPRAVPHTRSSRRSLSLKAGTDLHADQAAVLLHLRDRRARAPVRREHRARGRAQGLHDDRPAPAAERDQGDPRHPSVPHRPGRGDRLGRARRPARSAR